MTLIFVDALYDNVLGDPDNFERDYYTICSVEQKTILYGWTERFTNRILESENMNIVNDDILYG